MARTKSPDRERYPNGRAKALEGPTPETVKKHQERAEALHIPPSKEAGYAESTIGVLEARGMISIEQAELCKTLASLRSILFGTGQPKCSSVENASRGLPNDSETKRMRQTWTAYKAATEGIVKGDRVLFEMVVLRNAYREWMRLSDADLFFVAHEPDLPALVADNDFRSADGFIQVYAKRRELAHILRVIHTIHARMPREKRAAATTDYTAMSEAQRNALDGDEKLCALYAGKREREIRSGTL